MTTITSECANGSKLSKEAVPPLLRRGHNMYHFQRSVQPQFDTDRLGFEAVNPFLCDYMSLYDFNKCYYLFNSIYIQLQTSSF